MKKFTISTIFCSMLLSFNAFSKSNLWENVPSVPTPSSQTLFPQNYEIYQLNHSLIQSTLSKAGYTPEQTVLLDIPLPDGKTMQFKVWETPVLPAELQSQHQDIRTYTGISVEDPWITAKFDFTPYGFRAAVFGMSNTVMIDPYNKNADGYYLVYERESLTNTAFHNDACQTSVEMQEIGMQGAKDRLNQSNFYGEKKAGNVRKKYKLALATTGEYAVLVTDGVPSKPAVLAILVSTMNRCNAVFERELSVTTELISNNVEIIYLNKNTDPYEFNDVNDRLIDENQENLNEVLAGVPYDIGHILNTAGGGIAALSSVCDTSSKARGVSGSTGPEDFFVILHEMGHQFGAPHTFNSETGGCEGNIMPDFAYEPGSGSSIMAYSGLCAPNNIPYAGNYYHSSSLFYIHNYIVTGYGATCGTNTLGYNPIVFPDITKHYKIPTYTPIELIAPEATKDEPGGEIRYTWEQWDLGETGGYDSLASNWSVGPVFKFIEPHTSRHRIFPDLDKILDNSYKGPGQNLPRSPREFKFRLTARSLYYNWGTFNVSDNFLTAKSFSAGTIFRVTAPNTTELWEVGATKTIKWNTDADVNELINGKFVNILMSLNGGKTFPVIIASNVLNNGSYNMVVPNVFSDSVIFKVKGSGNIYFDLSKSFISIHGDPLSTDKLEINNEISIYPNPATDQVVIKDLSSKNIVLNVELINVLGQKVYSGTLKGTLNINTSNFAAGAYIIKIGDQQKTSTHKITIL